MLDVIDPHFSDAFLLVFAQPDGHESRYNTWDRSHVRLAIDLAAEQKLHAHLHRLSHFLPERLIFRRQHDEGCQQSFQTCGGRATASLGCIASANLWKA